MAVIKVATRQGETWLLQAAHFYCAFFVALHLKGIDYDYYPVSLIKDGGEQVGSI